ncbi:MAG: hypothetical protein JO283_05630 [Bradyrhizobium sp.]|nr:hypothetical protein [Bradyrhizobium sp.]
MSALPGNGLRSSMVSPALRISIGDRRKSSPSSSSRSKAQSTAERVVGQEWSRAKTASPLSSLTMASPSIRRERTGSAATAATMSGGPRAKLVAVAGV